MLAWLASHWLLLGAGGITAAALLFPAVSVPILRWLLFTESGRYVLLLVLAVTSFCWYRTERFADGYAAAVADQARDTDRKALDAAKAVNVRDVQGDTATDAATASANERQTAHNTRADRVEGIAREPRPPVPAACPGPDADLMRELAEGAARVRAAEDRLRGIGGPASQATRKP